VGIVRSVHALGESAKVVVEEPGVDVEGHGGGGMTEHPLDGFDVRAAGHQEAGGSVPKVVRAEVLQAGRSSRRVEHPAPEVARAQHRTFRGGDHEVVATLALTLLGQRARSRPGMGTVRR
jgi:hypothetical protein